ncbi:hypothetical protein B4102_3049 [Heyndrickxia sporothermodurans]|uniref:Uncharacterized protein n=1 Tax=Heyndrickxia sporothermodurans TaxID=46224 RepID=A0A150L325_9BACI|nr:hypothetical protein [Heyndrickxia sporothermodurans]KYD06664.1 hypothetical protein B4102_3049 [Heyndrickxia sporothermodurans]
MANKQSLDIYRLLKRNGFLLEAKINQAIQSQLNNESIIRQFGAHSKVSAAVIRKLQNSIEAISIPFNFPTKTDVANATKITIQTEEKVDLIDEKVNTILQSLEELKQLASEGVEQHE